MLLVSRRTASRALLAMGMAQVSIVAAEDLDSFVAEMRAKNFGVTCVTGQGAEGPVQIVFTIVRRRQLRQVIRLIEKNQPGAFYAVDEVTAVSDGIFPPRNRGPRLVPSALRTLLQKAMIGETGA